MQGLFCSCAIKKELSKPQSKEVFNSWCILILPDSDIDKFIGRDADALRSWSVVDPFSKPSSFPHS